MHVHAHPPHLLPRKGAGAASPLLEAAEAGARVRAMVAILLLRARAQRRPRCWGGVLVPSFFMQCSGLRTLLHTLSHTLSRHSPRTPPPSVRMLMDLLPGCCLRRLRCIPQRQRLFGARERPQQATQPTRLCHRREGQPTTHTSPQQACQWGWVAGGCWLRCWVPSHLLQWQR